MHDKEMSGFKNLSTATDDIIFFLRHFNPAPGGSFTALHILGEYNKTRLTDLHGFGEVMMPTGEMVKDRFENLKKSNKGHSDALFTAFSDILKQSQQMLDAEQKYNDAVADLNKNLDKYSHAKAKEEFERLGKEFHNELTREQDEKKQLIEDIFATRSADITDWFDVKTPAQQEELKKSLLNHFDTKHNEASGNADKLDKGYEERDKKYKKNIEDSAILARLWYFPQNRKHIVAALKERGMLKAGAVSMQSGAEFDKSILTSVDKNGEVLKLTDVYKVIKDATIAAGKLQKFTDKILPWRESIGLMVGDEQLLKYEESTDSFSSFELPGIEIKSKLLKSVTYGLISTFGIGTLSDDEIQAGLKIDLKLLKSIKDDLNFTITAVDEKRAMHLAKLACEEALHAGFKEENVTITIQFKGNTKQVKIDDILGSKKGEIMKKLQVEDQRKNDILAMAVSDPKQFQEKIPPRTSPNPPKKEEEEEQKMKPGHR